nr:hypothetical protein [uncultured Mediterranean phage uvMED]|tara:strand:- start:4280 stop:4528 length:249 start_codon:yes stop_codon:yes gene_type:complete
MIQKVINGIAILSGLVSLTVVSAAGYVYLQREEITIKVKSQAEKAIKEAITGALPVALDGALPEMPTQTMPNIPIKPSVPGF